MDTHTIVFHRTGDSRLIALQSDLERLCQRRPSYTLIVDVIDEKKQSDTLAPSIDFCGHNTAGILEIEDFIENQLE